MSDREQNPIFLDRMCECGHADSEHVVRYYETGNRDPLCERKSCACQHFRVERTS